MEALNCSRLRDKMFYKQVKLFNDVVHSWLSVVTLKKVSRTIEEQVQN